MKFIFSYQEKISRRNIEKFHHKKSHLIQMKKVALLKETHPWFGSMVKIFTAARNLECKLLTPRLNACARVIEVHKKTTIKREKK
jgi:hypothetical protein